jgi:RecB family exonuclease
MKSWQPGDGLVSPGDLGKAALARHQIGARSYSPTALQNFATCPYKFVLYALHKLAPREEPEALEELNPLQKGSLVHDILFALHEELKAKGLLPVREATYEATRATLDRVVAETAAKHKDDLSPAIERVWDDGVAQIKADLVEWMRRAQSDAEWTPSHFELSFGLTDRRAQDAASKPSDVAVDEGLRLRGSIDLVERRADGALRATDYKTGKARAKQDVTVIGGGEVLQPVLYALVLEKLFPGTKVEGGRLYYLTSAGDFTPVAIPLNEEARESARLVARTIGGALEGGFLPAAPIKGGCTYCDYLVVCGPYEELRARRKNPKKLETLVQLRRTR